MPLSTWGTIILLQSNWILSPPCSDTHLNLRKCPSSPKGLMSFMICLFLHFSALTPRMLPYRHFAPSDLLAVAWIHRRDLTSGKLHLLFPQSWMLFSRDLCVACSLCSHLCSDITSEWGLLWLSCLKLQSTSISVLPISHPCFSILHNLLKRKSLSLFFATKTKAPWGKGLFCLFYLLLYCRA